MSLIYLNVISPAGAPDAATSAISSSNFVNGATSKNLPAVQAVAPMPEDTEESMRYNCPTVGNYKMFIIHKGKRNFILILSLACFYFGFYLFVFCASWRQILPLKHFCDSQGNIWPNSSRRVCAFFRIFCVTLSIFLSCTDSLWQGSLVLLSHFPLKDFTSFSSLSLFQPVMLKE